ncbi:DUF3696 domain-containing protein [Pedobacter yonginense]|uniref:DUF3696 domain-containing protein n=1 Tax=Pedobacter yonginense TaxID=651869 RepID=A0A317EMB2_9SPHI|nr:DUF3696 domain-containing protein [Pedobacter yonginense]PWS27109.1 DUF3696 domain-containing protein [Pedobacter yonginense]
MISKIKIGNFKSLKDLTLDCGKLNIITGLNSMGKSSIIQAFLLLRQSFDRGFLKKEGLSLRGDLVDIGVAREALYQYAAKEEIQFDLNFEGHADAHSWIFGYQLNEEGKQYNYNESDFIPFAEDSRNAYDSNDVDLASLSLFNAHFKYLDADRWVKNQYERSDFHVVQNRGVGRNGEYTAHYLASFGEENIEESLMYPGTENKNLLAQVSAWMGDISPGTIVKAEKIQGVNSVKLSYEFETTTGRTNEVSPLNVGFGMTYVLPVIVLLLSARPGDIILIENPESHIHPKGQSSIGRLLTKVANLGVQLFIETHSDHILNGTRVGIKDGISSELVKIFFIERGEFNTELYSQAILPEIDNEGGIKNWPKDFFDQSIKDLNYLFGI